jgi:hypothetical protein
MEINWSGMEMTSVARKFYHRPLITLPVTYQIAIRITSFFLCGAVKQSEPKQS